MIPYFPEHIFDGTHDFRPNLQEVRPPDRDDYIRLSKELQETQNFILTRLKNLEATPDVLSKLRMVYKKAENLEKNLEKYVTPAEMDTYIKGVETKLDRLIEKTSKLQKLLAKTNLEYSDLRERIQSIEDGWETDVTAFQRYNRGEYARLKQAVQESLDDLKKQLQSLKDILGS